MAFLLTACGDDEADDGASFLDELTDEDLPLEEVDGVTVAVDEEGGTIYVEDCDDARRLTDPETGAFPTFGFICPS